MNVKEGDWVQYMNSIGQSEFGRVRRIIKELHSQKVKVEIVKFNHQKVLLTENDDFVKVDLPVTQKLEVIEDE